MKAKIIGAARKKSRRRDTSHKQASQGLRPTQMEFKSLVSTPKNTWLSPLFLVYFRSPLHAPNLIRLQAGPWKKRNSDN